MWASLYVEKEKDKKHFFVKIFIEIYTKLPFEVQKYVLSASLDQGIRT